MPTYRIHRLKDHLRQQVRFAPHVSGTALVKPRDYQLRPEGEAAPQEQVEASSPYAAFFTLRCLLVMRFRRRSDIVGIKISSVCSHYRTNRPSFESSQSDLQGYSA